MKAIFGSSNTFYVRSYLELLLKSYEEVDLVDTGHIDYQNTDLRRHIKLKGSASSSTKSKVKRMVKMLGVKNLSIFRKILNKANQKNSIYIDQQYTSSVFFWGTAIMPVFNRIENKDALGKKILIINTFPIDFSTYHKISDDEIKYFSSFDVLICSTKFMADYLSNFIDITKLKVIPDFIVKDKIFPSKKANRIKKVCFLGNINFSDRVSDDISKEILSLNKKKGIDVYTQGENGDKQFKPFSYQQVKNGELNEFLNQNFDAILYTYNSKKSLRESISITTRFSLGEGSGLPIILDKSKYCGLIDQFKDKYLFIDIDSIHEINSLSIKSYCYNQDERINQFLEIIE